MVESCKGKSRSMPDLTGSNPIVGSPEWVVSSQRTTGDDAAGNLVMAWARDKATGEPRYIGELALSQGGKRCSCKCLSCGLDLIAVNAGKLTYRRRPHFRHPEGAEKDSCLILSARAAALEAFRKEGFLELPLRGLRYRAVGLSGHYYDAWVEAPAERVRVREFAFNDLVSGVLTLDDGRRLRVELIGSIRANESMVPSISTLTPTIRLVVDDPRIAAMPPDEIRKRLHLLVEAGTWCSHWIDEKLRQDAEAKAFELARTGLDWPDEGLVFAEELSPAVKRETLLHLKAKEILERAKRIALPELYVDAECLRHIGSTALTKHFTLPGKVVDLEAVELERSMGRIRPDVMATSIATPDWPASRILIEITVTNAITDERLARIEAQNLPTLEIDISRMGGRVTEIEFERLVVEEVAGKRWLHHPRLVEEKVRIERELAEAVGEMNRFARRQDVRRTSRAALMETPIEKWRDLFLEAVLVYVTVCEQDPYNENAEALSFNRLAKCAEGLAAYGYLSDHDRQLRDMELVRILKRILSIKLDRSVGYKLGTSWQVINAILQDQAQAAKWHTLYLIAIKCYQPTLTIEQAAKVEGWRGRVWESLKSSEDAYQRSRRLDRFLSLLFPEMASRLQKPLVPADSLVDRQSLGGISNQRLNHCSAPGESFPNPADPWLRGHDYEKWKLQHPEEAKAWEACEAFRNRK